MRRRLVALRGWLLWQLHELYEFLASDPLPPRPEDERDAS